MSPAQFTQYWSLTYPETIPISHYLKWDCEDRWFRIHSLPASKRYADNLDEWSILLQRQNTLITDLLGTKEFYLITGEYFSPKNKGIRKFIKGNKVFRHFQFSRLSPIDLHAHIPEQYDKGTFYQPVIAKLTWQPHKYDTLLKAIADDETRAIFMSTQHHCLIAPYDGGIDIVLQNETVRENYRKKYRDWLPGREDGL